MGQRLLALFAAAVIVLPVSGHEYAHSGARRRKTLGFGPQLPAAIFQTSPAHASAFLGKDVQDPFKLAEEFVTSITSDVLAAGANFYIRDDSYTDSNSGISHIYVRQVIDDLEVVNGHINLNIRDGVVLSYGDTVSGIPVEYHLV